MGELDVPEDNMTHPFALFRSATQFDNPVEIRRNHAVLRRVLLPFLRHVGQHARGPVKIPFARSAERFLHVLDNHPVPLLHDFPGPGAVSRPRGIHPFPLVIHARDWRAEDCPDPESDDLDVGEMCPVSTNVSALIANDIDRSRLGCARDHAATVCIPLLRHTRPRLADIVHKELAEVPRSGGHLGHSRCPPAFLVVRPACYPAARADNWLLVGRSGIDCWRCRSA